MNQSIKEIKEDIDLNIRGGYLASVARCAIMLANDNRLNNNFETALAALIEHHGADALTSLAAVMRHYEISMSIYDNGVYMQPDINIEISADNQLISTISNASQLTANGIKPEK